MEIYIEKNGVSYLMVDRYINEHATKLDVADNFLDSLVQYTKCSIESFDSYLDKDEDESVREYSNDFQLRYVVLRDAVFFKLNDSFYVMNEYEFNNLIYC